MRDADASEDLVERVRVAHARHAPLRIVGGDTKSFYGRPVRGESLSTEPHRGIVAYDPAELVITVRSGTPLAEVESVLSERGQCLPFEPPRFGDGGTVGGMVAAGLAGPARCSAGSVRDHVLGARLLTGDARVLKFGGEVIKNVAGYDVSRLLAGSLGILGVLLEVSLKVLPRRPASVTQVLELDAAAALERIAELARSAWPLIASCWVDGSLYLRFDASAAALERVRARIGGESLSQADAFWTGVRDHTHPFFSSAERLVRVYTRVSSSPQACPELPLIEWHGAERWYRNVELADVDGRIADQRAQVCQFRGGDLDSERFAALPAPLARLHRTLKNVFDPVGILNPGRMYADL